MKNLWLLLVFTAGCMTGEHSERELFCEGENAAYSPDGTRIAFQRRVGETIKLGIFNRADGSVEWVENGAGMAAYPTWSPRGELIYTYGNITETAWEMWKVNNTQRAYNLWIWHDGVKRELTTGRCRDYTPAVSPDGKSVYFATSRWSLPTDKRFKKFPNTSFIGCIDINGGEPQMIIDSPNGVDTGVVQPAVSPDGKVMAFGALMNFHKDCWRIFGAKLTEASDKTKWVAITPKGLVAISPRWHPNGKLICFTGFNQNDEDWGVWVEEVSSGKAKRLATGMNPDFSPDGTSIVYDRDGKLFERSFTNADWPTRSITREELFIK